jgi:hypothetical protein
MLSTTKAYDDRRQRLSPEKVLRLALREEHISADPDGTFERERISDNLVYDRSDFLLVAYVRLSRTEALLVRFQFLDDPSDW